MINMNPTNKKGEISSTGSRPGCTASKDRPLKSPNRSTQDSKDSQGLHHQKSMERKKPLDPKELMEEYAR